MIRLMVFLMIIGLSVSMAYSAVPLPVIPKPVKMEQTEGFFSVSPDTTILVERETRALGKQLAGMLATPMGYTLAVRNNRDNPAGSIRLRKTADLSDLGEEGYRLSVTPQTVLIESGGEAGIFYGIQTLRQLLPTAVFAQKPVQDVKWHIPCVAIEDKPRFEWRGLHLDVCRHFMPVEFVKKYIDLLALHKMNTFHWHLTEDQGWRIEIKKYPKLTEIGAWRAETVIGRNTGKYDGKRHGGYYTQDEVRDIVKFAQERFITVVPEIEMPGHSVAALAAYPELSCTGGPFEVRKTWGISRDVYCAGNDKTIEFLQDVLTEVLALFPSEYIHIGGDECPKVRWENCPKCQARIKAEGLEDEHELQSWFIRQMDVFLTERGRRLVGWDEILEGGLAAGATVMSWRGEAGGIKAAQSGHDVVMAPNSHTYFDYYQAEPADEPLAIGGFLPLERVYSYNPTPEALTEKEKEHILGVQGQIWTEYIPNPDHAEYMAYPRACALAEVAWAPVEGKDYKRFYKRLEQHLERLRKLEVNYRRLDPLPVIVGRWTSGQTTEQFQPMRWDLNDDLETGGRYRIKFSYTSGRHRLDIQSVEILENGKVVAEDNHTGITGAYNKDNIYNVTIPDCKATASYQLRAVVRSDGGTDSNGTIYLFSE